MQLSLKTDFALRMLIALASTKQHLSIDSIAYRYDISRNHLAKVTQHLSSAGYIETFRGRGGGMTLAMQPSEINIGKVVRELEQVDNFVSCMGDRAGCTIDGVCTLKPILGQALGLFLAYLDQYTLADVTADLQPLQERLGLEVV